MKRRSFLKNSAKGIVLPSLLGGMSVKAFAKSEMLSGLLPGFYDTDHVLVLIYLAGGNDGLNTVVPVDQYSRLYNARPEVVIPEPTLLKLDGTDTIGLHPALGAFRKMYNDGQLRIMQSVGYPNPNYSHFRATDIWMSGSDENEIFHSGWAGRYLAYEYPNYPVDYPNDIMPDPLAIEIGWSGSLMFQGPIQNMGMTVSDPSWFYKLVDDSDDPTPDNKYGDQLKYVRLIKRQSQIYGETLKSAFEKVTFQGDYPDTDLANQLKVVSRLIAGGLKTRLYMVTLGGFDTHSNQVDASNHTVGMHTELLTQVNDAISAFTKDLLIQGTSKRVVGMTFSEFGRRIKSNASGGTDHGAAAPMFLFGEHVNGGVQGNNPIIPENVDVEDNLQMETDFRSVYASLLNEWFCVEKEDIPTVLLKDKPLLPLIKDTNCNLVSIHEANASAGYSLFNCYPNPCKENLYIKYNSNGQPATVQIYDISGRVVHYAALGKTDAGMQVSPPVSVTDLNPGNYFIRLQMGSVQQSRPFIKI